MPFADKLVSEAKRQFDFTCLHIKFQKNINGKSVGIKKGYSQKNTNT